MVSGAAFMGDIENRHLANAFNLAVISVDYRLAPEFPFPAASEDSFKIARWLVDNAMEEFGTQKNRHWGRICERVSCIVNVAGS